MRRYWNQAAVQNSSVKYQYRCCGCAGHRARGQQSGEARLAGALAGMGYHQWGLLPAHVTGQYFPEAAAQAAGV